MMAHFGTHILVCFRPIQQDLCPQQKSIVSGFNQMRKNLSLFYFCKWLHIFSTGKLSKSAFCFLSSQYSLGSTAAKQTRFMGRFL